jgi:rubrerythrin
MGETGVRKSSNELKSFECPLCNGTFYLRKTENPYKCPFCNYTFELTPRLKQKERL